MLEIVANFDVLIAGSGTAGCATALSLAAFAELRVGLVVHLGVWDVFSGGGHCPSYRTTAALGDSRLAGNEFLFHAHQGGWRLDRAAFDRMLVKAASSRVSTFFRAKVVALVGQTEE